MKLNKIYYMPAMFALVAAAFAGCSSDDPEPGPSGDTQLVTIRTNVTMNTEASLITELGDGKAMNVYVKAFNDIKSEDLLSDVKATNIGGNWTLSPELRLAKDVTAFLYATYPYSEANSDPTAIPVDVNKQIDVLYSGPYVAATYNTHDVTLNMRHAYSMLSLNIKGEGYSSAGKVTKLAVSGGEHVVTKGTLNVTTGKIEPAAYGEVSGEVSGTVTAAGISGSCPSLWVVPFNTQYLGNVLTLKATIDGKEYTATLPEVVMRTGWQYIFQAILTPNGLVVIPDATEEYQLDKIDDEFGALNGYGALKIGFSGGEFHFPVFTGDNVFGNIVAGGQTMNYTIGGKVTLTGTQTITVETWNSTGFSLNSLEGVNSIDISQY